MKHLIDRDRRDLTPLGLAAGVVLLCLVRLLLAAQGRVFLIPESSPIDDQLMYNAAVSISEGRWLGDYQYNTIAKHMFFSVWLAFVHRTGIPYLVANAALLLGSAWCMASALAPLLKKRGWVLGAFFLLAYCPVGFDQYNYRVYRDSITVALLLFAFGGVIGCVLRAFAPEAESCAAKKRRMAALYGWAAVGGLGLGTSWLNREDGVWLLPFVLCFLVLGAAALLKTRGLRKSLGALAGFCLPFVLMGCCLAAYAGMNLKYYGRFLVSDLTSREFTTAYGLLTGIEDKETGRYRPITKATRQKLYDNSDFFAALEPYWENTTVLNGYGDPTTGEYGGSYYYGLRLASQFAGYYTDAHTAKAHYEAITAELLRLEEDGIITFARKARSTVPYWRSEYLLPTLEELGRGLAMSLLCLDFDMRPTFSMYIPELTDVEPMLEWLNADMVRGYAAGTDQPYYNPLQKLAFAGETALCWIWRILGLPAAACGLWFAGRYWKRGFRFLFGKEKTPEATFLLWVLLWGLLLSAVLRCALMAYMEVTAFDIGTYLMYQSTAVPLLGLFGLLGVREAFEILRLYRRTKE